MNINDGTKSIVLGFKSNLVQFANGLSTITSYSIDTSQFHEYEIRKIGSTVTLNIDGVAVRSTALSNFEAIATKNFVFGAASSPATVNADVDYVRYEINPQLALTGTSDVSYNGGVLPSTEGWVNEGNLAESTHASLSGGVVTLNDNGTNASNYIIYNKTASITPTSDFIYRVYGKTNSCVFGAVRTCLAMHVSNGARFINVGIRAGDVNFLNSGAITAFAVASGTPGTVYSLYELQKTGSTVTLKINGVQVLSTSVTNFDATANTNFGFGAGGFL